MIANMKLLAVLTFGAAGLVSAQNNPPPSPVLLTTTKSGVLPVLPTPFNGVETLEGAIIMKAPVNASYTPVNGPAQTQTNQPAATYQATLPAVPFDGLTGTVIQGTATGSTQQGQTGVNWSFNFTGLPDVSQYGPFVYHIHDMPVPADGNCTATMGHFDPTNSGEYYTCDTSNPQNCQAGDLAGKHGMIMGQSFSTSYVDNFLSTDPSSEYFFGMKSIVIHSMNTTRLTCANFVMAQGGAGASSSGYQNPTVTATSGYQSPSASSSGPIASYTGNSAAKAVPGGFVAGIAAFLGLML